MRLRERPVPWMPVVTVLGALSMSAQSDDKSPQDQVKQLVAESTDVREAARQWLNCNAEEASGALIDAVRGEDANLAVAAGRVLTEVHAPWSVPREDVYEKKTGLAQRVVDRITGIEFVLVAVSEDPAARSFCYLGRYEVTIAQWREAMGSVPERARLGDSLPVAGVSWTDVHAFLEKTAMRLPTESEWTAACGGDDATIGDIAVFGSESAHPVGERRSNPLGIYDMLGNVWEWCEDDPAPARREMPDHLLLGGSFRSSERGLRVDARRRERADYVATDVGFRVARDAMRVRTGTERAVRRALSRAFPEGLDLTRTDPLRGEFWTTWRYRTQTAHLPTTRTQAHVRIRSEKVESIEVRVEVNDNVDDPNDLAAAQWILDRDGAQVEERRLRALIERVLQPR